MLSLPGERSLASTLTDPTSPARTVNWSSATCGGALESGVSTGMTSIRPVAEAVPLDTV